MQISSNLHSNVSRSTRINSSSVHTYIFVCFIRNSLRVTLQGFVTQKCNKYQYQYVKDFHMEYFVCHVMQEGINFLQLVLRNIYLEYFLAGAYAYLSFSGEITSCNAKVFLLLDINLKYMSTYFLFILSFVSLTSSEWSLGCSFHWW